MIRQRTPTKRSRGGEAQRALHRSSTTSLYPCCTDKYISVSSVILRTYTSDRRERNTNVGFEVLTPVVIFWDVNRVVW
jgi:hypothetical protein